MVAELVSGACGERVAFLSTPSVYFSLPEASAVRAHSLCFDFDDQWRASANFRFYDFHEGAEAIPADERGSFDAVVVDPPFITRDVWASYAQTIRAALKPGGRAKAAPPGDNLSK